MWEKQSACTQNGHLYPPLCVCISLNVLFMFEAAWGGKEARESVSVNEKLTRNRCCCWVAQYVLRRGMAVTLGVLPALLNLSAAALLKEEIWRRTNIALAPHCYVIFSSSSLIYQPSNLLVSEVYSKTYIFFLMLGSPRGARPPVWGSAITLRHTTLGRTL